MKSDYTVRAKKFLNDIYPFIRNSRDIYEIKMNVRMYNWRKSRKVSCAHGISRMALITSDYVIKFNLPKKNFCSGCGDCENEMRFYNFAAEHGYEYLFAKITKVTIEGKNFYIMPRIEGIGKFPGSYVDEFLNEDDRSFVENYLYDMHDENYGWKNGYPVIIDYASNFFLDEETPSSQMTIE